MSGKLSFFALCLSLSAMLFSTPVSALNDWQSRPGTVAHTLSLADDTQVTLDGMVVVKQVDFYIFVKDPWSGSNHLPVYVGTRQVEQWSSVEITGVTDTIAGQRIVVASQLRQYLTPNGMPFIMMPKGMDEPYEWEYMLVIPGTNAKRIPSPPAEEEELITIPPAGMEMESLMLEELFPGPMAMNNRALAAGAKDSYGSLTLGLDTAGMSVTTCGKVTYAGSDFFRISDGSINDAIAHPLEIRVNWPWPGYIPPAVDSLVVVTGISGVYEDETRMLTPDASAFPPGIVVCDPVDTTDPVLTVTAPSGEPQWHIAPGTADLVISGTADDIGSGLAYVQVVTGTEPHLAPYDSQDHTWSYTWPNPTDGATVTVRAADLAGNVASCQADVSVVPTVIYVDPAGNDTNGLSWGTAKRTVVGGLSAATGPADIWVADGTYTGCITMKSDVGLYGGFVGGATGEMCREQRNWAANPTILDGNDSGSVVTISGLSNCVVDGFTIQDGSGTGEFACGGGVFCPDSAATIANNIIRDNTAWYGVGLYADSPSYPGSGSSELSLIGNVFVSNTAQYGGGVVHLDTVEGQIINNTIIDNEGCGMSLSSSAAIYPDVINNIISENTICGLTKAGTGSPTFSKNAIHKNGLNETTNYEGMARPATDLLLLPDDDLGISNIEQGDWHISWGSPCRCAGDNSVVLPTGRDIDGEPRRNGPIDIGADEANQCTDSSFTLTPPSSSAQIGTEATLTASVRDAVADEGISGLDVVISVVPGEITSFTVNGNVYTPPGGTTTVTGTTDADGIVVVRVRRTGQGFVNVTGTISQCSDQVTRTARVFFEDLTPRSVGFLYDLCLGEDGGGWVVRGFIDDYLARVATAYPQVTYQHIACDPDPYNPVPFVIDPSYNVVFLAMPTRDLLTSELAALSTFASSGRNKRLVLIGEHSLYFSDSNSRLNVITESLAMDTLFSTSGSLYDDPYGLCGVNGSHYLAQGVVNLWDSWADTFQAGWQTSAEPLAYLNDDPTKPWIVEEDTDEAGSIILIHDSSMFLPDYDNDHDTVPDKNFMFLHNLCTVFLMP